MPRVFLRLKFGAAVFFGTSWVGLAAPIPILAGEIPIALLHIEARSPETSTWRPLREGVEVPVEAGQTTTLLCPDGWCRELSAPFEVTNSLCKSSTPKTCRRAAAPSNRLRNLSDPPKAPESFHSKEALDVISGWLGRLKPFVLTGRARGQEKAWGKDPVLVAPRCLASGAFCHRRAEPTHLIFLKVKDARRYLFELTGPSRYDSLLLSSKQISDCRAEPAFGNVPLCRVPWPKTWRLPTNGRPTELRMSVETATGLRPSKNPTTLALRTGHTSFDAEPELLRLQDPLRLRQAGFRQELLEALLNEPSLTAPQELLLAQVLFELGLTRPAKFYFERVAGIQNGEPAGITTGEMRATALLAAALCAVELDDPDLARKYEGLYLSTPSAGAAPSTPVIQELRQHLRSRLDG